MAIYSAVPVPVLEALASAWEDQDAKRHRDWIGTAGERLSAAEHARLDAYADCARQLREAITRGSAG